jgi:hypothetical protein
MDTEYTKGFRAGSAFQQERIIKLLDGKIIVKNILYNELPEEDKYMNLMLGHVIALIKRETNE